MQFIHFHHPEEGSKLPENIRVLRYHMTSGHVVQELVTPDLADTDDLTLLEHLAEVCSSNLYIKIKEASSDSAVLVAVNAIEFVQVGHAQLVMSVEEVDAATASEEQAVERAREHLNGGDHDED